MDSENQRYQVTFPEASYTANSVHIIDAEVDARSRSSQSAQALSTQASSTQAASSIIKFLPDPLPATIEDVSPEELLNYIRSGQVWIVNSRQRNGVILRKPFHTEFAGPGAAVGGYLDLDCQQVIPMGRLSLVRPASHQDQQNAYLIRRQWIKLTQQVTDRSVPLQRAQMILNQFETYFDRETVARIPDEAFALMVGVLPYTIRMARRPPGKLTVKVRG